MTQLFSDLSWQLLRAKLTFFDSVSLQNLISTLGTEFNILDKLAPSLAVLTVHGLTKVTLVSFVVACVNPTSSSSLF